MTIAAWVSGVAALDVTGVKRTLDSPPQQVNAGDLPLTYPRIPTGGAEVASFGGAMGLTTVTVEWILVGMPIMLSTSKAEFVRCLALMDAMQTALMQAVNSGHIDRFTIRQETIDTGGDVAYWGLIATVEGSF